MHLKLSKIKSLIISLSRYNVSIKIVKGSYSTTLDSASLSGDQTVTLPNASGTLTLSSQLATVATSGAYNDLSGKPTFAKVATSGSYNDLSNKPSIPSTPKGYITQTWRSGNDWYRVYSDGWIEQGGYCPAPQTRNTTITYKKAFSAKPICLLVTTRGNLDNGGYSEGVQSESNTKFVFIHSYSNSNSNYGYWLACGY